LIRIARFQKMFPEPPWLASDIVIFEQALATRDKRARSHLETISVFVRQALTPAMACLRFADPRRRRL
jgi:hypothetical protein